VSHRRRKIRGRTVQLYFDESGDFNPRRRDEQRFSFVVGVIVPETAADALKADFDWFVGQLSPCEFAAREPKGHLLTLDHRRLLLEVLKAHRSVMLVPISVNLGRDDPAFFETAPATIRALIESNLETESSFMTVTDRAELAKRIGRLSGQDLVRLLSYGIAVLKGIEGIACRYHCEQFHSNYDPIAVTFDRVVRAGTRQELVFRDALFGWISNWSRTVPLKIPSSLDESHPLLIQYADKVSGQWVFDLKKMLLGKITFVDSKMIWQIQLADFLANTWSRTIADWDGKTGYGKLFQDLYRKSVLPNETPLGVVAPTDRTEVVSAPAHLEVFARMAFGVQKILPCE
jgi:Protein of unknown function (DUF3800)